MSDALPSSTVREGTRVALADLTVRIGSTTLLESAAAEFEPGKITLIVGPSGAGKSVLLRVIAGLVREQSPISVTGDVRLGERLRGASASRPVGVVFQNFALFDELSSIDNVRFAAAHRADRDLPEHETLAPKKLLQELRVPRGVRTAELSGGQRQRLAIARTLAYNPEVILYDEPTSGLDAATAGQVADLICRTHETHPRTSIIVTHDYESLSAIADAIYLLDPATRTLRLVDREDWPRLRELLRPVSALTGATEEVNDDEENEHAPSARTDSALTRLARSAVARVGDFFATTTRAVEAAVRAPFSLLPIWNSPRWGLRYAAHYLRLVAGPSAWLYIAISGLIMGFVGTYFTYKFLPYRETTETLLNEDLLDSLGFALYRILVPVLATILIAARCGAAVASDVGGKVYGQQFDALRSFGVPPSRYLLTGSLWAFLLGGPFLVAIAYLVAETTSLIVFTATHPGFGPQTWRLYFFDSLRQPDTWVFAGTHWLAAKVLLCCLGVGAIAYYRGALPKYSTRDVSRGVTSTILWGTLFVLVVHFAFAFFEFE